MCKLKQMQRTGVLMHWDFFVALESECQRVSPDPEYVLCRRACGRGKYKKRKPTSQSAFKKLVAGIGFEPMTFRL